MQTRPLGDSDPAITLTGYWAIGGAGREFGRGPQRDEDSVAAILRSLELGVSWIDTAAVYGLGHSEEVVARAPADRWGERPLVFTKCGLVWDSLAACREDFPGRWSGENAKKVFAGIRVEAVDLYQVYWPSEDDRELEEGWAELAELKRERRVRGPESRTSTSARWSGHGHRAALLPPDDWRRNPEFNEPNRSRNLALVRR